MLERPHTDVSLEITWLWVFYRRAMLLVSWPRPNRWTRKLLINHHLIITRPLLLSDYYTFVHLLYYCCFLNVLKSSRSCFFLFIAYKVPLYLQIEKYELHSILPEASRPNLNVHNVGLPWALKYHLFKLYFKSALIKAE